MKKTFINDFSALKGKISFSDESPAAKPEPNKPEKKTEAKADRSIRVGQSIVMMDSDMRGKIISLGKTVGIELEDGLCIQASYNEFAVTDKDEVYALSQSQVKVKKTSSPKAAIVRTGTSLLQVDLHIEAIPGCRSISKGRELQFQMDTFRKVIRENLSHRGMTITFIHGIGDGILKAAIRKELDEVHAHRCSYSVGDPAVTVVTIK